jgi:hypothetical protein
MTYVLINNNTVASYPYSVAKLRQDNPQVSFPSAPSIELLEEYGVFEVVETAQPVYNPITHDLLEIDPVFSNGAWTQTWQAVAVDAEVATERQRIATLIADANAAKIDTFVSQFIAMTPAQTQNYVDNNTANLTDVRALLRKIVLMLHILARREFG